ncbi:hypothetical protein C6569_11565 [Phreatobacter cathodiphilus]|uniref:Uncharacterized protein n=2 Tax=Phreatobacter cathodiphilus TaxID=1868589 RepID=A0A2S0NCK1_9HYPH|nr:hypothetical protein C6569_11565 [Phreatobacter cathodiphilus]
MGEWGDGTTPDDRFLLSMLFRRAANSFMVVDAAPGLEKFKDLAARAVSRDQVIGYPVARYAFMIVDAIGDDDPRVADLVAAC